MRYHCKFHILVYLSLLVCLNGEIVDLDLAVDRTGWIDPNDPFTSTSYCSKDILDQLTACEMELEQCVKNTEQGTSTENRMEKYCVHDPTLKHVIRNLLYRIGVDIDKAKLIDRTVQMYLSAGNLEVLRKYLNTKVVTITQREQVREILEQFITPLDYEEGSLLKHIFDKTITFLPVLNIILLVPALIILFRSHFSTRSLIWLVLYISFVLSVFTTYHKKHQANLAARMMRAEKSAAERCKPKDFFSTALEIVSGLLFMSQKSECLQFYEDLYIDPVYEISPLDIMSDVLSNFVFIPLGIFGHHFNIFMNEYYRDSPWYMILIKTITFSFLVLVILFWLCGYRLRTPVATLEPAGIMHTVSWMGQLFNDQPSTVEQAAALRSILPRFSPLPIDLKSRNKSALTIKKRRSLSASYLKKC